VKAEGEDNADPVKWVEVKHQRGVPGSGEGCPALNNQRQTHSGVPLLDLFKEFEAAANVLRFLQRQTFLLLLLSLLCILV
jgi:hypothetical protein